MKEVRKRVPLDDERRIGLPYLTLQILNTLKAVEPVHVPAREEARLPLLCGGAGAGPGALAIFYFRVLLLVPAVDVAFDIRPRQVPGEVPEVQAHILSQTQVVARAGVVRLFHEIAVDLRASRCLGRAVGLPFAAPPINKPIPEVALARAAAQRRRVGFEELRDCLLYTSPSPRD